MLGPEGDAERVLAWKTLVHVGRTDGPAHLPALLTGFVRQCLYGNHSIFPAADTFFLEGTLLLWRLSGNRGGLFWSL